MAQTRLITTSKGYSILLMLSESKRQGIDKQKLKTIIDIADIQKFYKKSGYVLIGWDEEIKDLSLYNALKFLKTIKIPYKFLMIGEDNKIKKDFNDNDENGEFLPDLYVEKKIKISPEVEAPIDIKFIKLFDEKLYEEIIG